MGNNDGMRLSVEEIFARPVGPLDLADPLPSWSHMGNSLNYAPRGGEGGGGGARRELIFRVPGYPPPPPPPPKKKRKKRNTTKNNACND